MGQVTRIEVFFDDDVVKPGRRVVIRPGGTVKAVVFEDAAGDISLTTANEKERGTPIRKEARRPSGVIVLPEEPKLTDGLRGVCYLEDGVLKCWDPG